MVTADLIPDEFKTHEQRLKRLRLWILITVAGCCGAAAWAGVKYLSYRHEDKASYELVQQCQEIQNNIQQLNDAKKQLDLWQDRIAVYDKLGRYPNYARITDYLSRHSPSLVFLKELSFLQTDQKQSQTNIAKVPLPDSAKMFLLKKEPTAAAAPRYSTGPVVTMFIRGRALDYQTVAEYLKTLRDSDVFIDALLKNVSGRRISPIR